MKYLDGSEGDLTVDERVGVSSCENRPLLHPASMQPQTSQEKRHSESVFWDSLADPICPRNTEIIHLNRVFPSDYLYIYTGGAITEEPKVSDKIDHRICTGCISFNRFRKELYNRPTASLERKAQRVKSEVVEALLYGCATWTPLKSDY